jgi:hypothetical protein
MNAKSLIVPTLAAAAIVGCMIVKENKPADTAPPPPATTPAATTAAPAPAPTPTTKRPSLKQTNRPAVDGG